MGILHTIMDLARSEASDPSLAPLAGRAARAGALRPIKRLHGHDRGVVSIFFLLMFFTFFNAGALVWNTGQTMGPRLKAQAAADVAAYNTSVIMSRAVNLTAMTNYAAVRNASAFTCAVSSVSVYVCVPVFWTQYIIEQAQRARAATGNVPIVSDIAAAAAAIAATIEIIVTELPHYIDFIMATSPQLSEGFDAINRVTDLADFQTAIIRATPGIIEEQRRITEQAFGGVSIRLSQPISSGDSGADVANATGGDSGLVSAPLKEGDVFSAGAWFNARYFLADRGWPNSDTLERIRHGRGVASWYIGGVPTIEVVSIYPGMQLHVLTTQTLALEFAPDDADSRRAFSVVASATETPETRRQLFLNYWFNKPVNRANRITAYAEAETFLGLDGTLTSAGYSPPVPWRAWTPPGANWAGRLRRADHFGDAFREDPTMRSIYSNTILRNEDVDDRIPKINLH